MPVPATALRKFPALDVEHVPWEVFRRRFGMRWSQGEHVVIIGPTGQGKTELATRLLPIRSHVVVFGAKGRDTTLDQLLTAGYERAGSWNGLQDVYDRIVLWPQIKGAEHWREQREVFADAMAAIYRSGGWCTVFDEVVYMARFLRLERELEFLLQQGRSAGISVMAMTQRPAFIPLAFYDQSSHVFVFKDPDTRNIQREAEFTGTDRRFFHGLVHSLKKHEFVYYNKDTGYMARSKVEV